MELALAAAVEDGLLVVLEASAVALAQGAAALPPPELGIACSRLESLDVPTKQARQE